MCHASVRALPGAPAGRHDAAVARRRPVTPDSPRKRAQRHHGSAPAAVSSNRRRDAARRLDEATGGGRRTSPRRSHWRWTPHAASTKPTSLRPPQRSRPVAQSPNGGVQLPAYPGSLSYTKWTRSPWSVGARLPRQRPHTIRAPATLTLASLRGRSTEPPSRVPTDSPHSRHDSSTHLVRLMRAPRSTSLVDICHTPYRARASLTVRHMPYCPPDFGTGSLAEYFRLTGCYQHWANLGQGRLSRRVGGSATGPHSKGRSKHTHANTRHLVFQTRPAHLLRRRPEVLPVRQCGRVDRKPAVTHGCCPQRPASWAASTGSDEGNLRARLAAPALRSVWWATVPRRERRHHPASRRIQLARRAAATRATAEADSRAAAAGARAQRISGRLSRLFLS